MLRHYILLRGLLALPLLLLLNPFQPNNAGGPGDAFITKISDLGGTPTPTSTSSPTATHTPALTSTPTCTPSWHIVSSQNPGSDDNWLEDVAVVSGNDIWSVGYFKEGGNPAQTLVEHWDGSSWTVVSSPNSGTGDNYLQSVAVVSANDVWAVGYYVNGSNVKQTLTLHWNGSVWSIVSSPNVGGADNRLEGVSGVLSDDVWAVGYYGAGGADQTLTLHWNGAIWSVISSPNPGSTNSNLRDVVAISTNDVWAVGNFDAPGIIQSTLTLHWNGSAWSVVTSANAFTRANILNSVDARATDDIWAVGYYDTSGSVNQTLTLHWDGANWNVIPSPNPGPGGEGHYLYGVTAITPTDAWAVGFYGGFSPQRTMTLHWDGANWNAVSSPNANANGNQLYGVDTVSATNVWAVGYYATTPRNETLIEQYSVTCASSLPTATGTVIATDTPTMTPTDTPPGTPTSTPVPTNTPALTPSSTATSTVVGVPTPAPGPIAGGPGDQQTAQIDGNIVVWEDDSAGTWDIQAKDISSGSFFPIIVAPLDQRNPAISGDLVVWQDNHNGTWDILGAYISGGQAGTPFNIFVGPEDQINPAVSGSRVVWQSGSPARWEIVAKDLSNGQLTTLSSVSTSSENPAIDGAIAVWQSMPTGGGPWDTLGYDFTSGTPINVSQSAIDKINPAISGSLVVWQEEYTGSRWRIAGVNISNSDTFTLTESLDSQFNPAIYGSTVVYQDSHEAHPLEVGTGAEPLVHGRWTVLQREVTPGPIRLISNDRIHDAVRPAISNAVVVWEQRPHLEAAQPHLLPLGEDTGSDIYGTVCGSAFTDVPSGQTFFSYVQWMACRAYVSGYACGGEGEPCPGSYFRPNANVTRGQLAKIVSNAAQFTEAIPSGQQTFADVYIPPAPGSTFYEYIERLSSRGIISGYLCGGEGEPCDELDRPYFRPGNNATRGQIAKIVSSAAGYSDDIPPDQQTFTDVAPGGTFWLWVERLSAHEAIGGYPCGGEGEPCDDQNRPYFRPGNNTTRGQLSKIATIAFGGP